MHDTVHHPNGTYMYSTYSPNIYPNHKQPLNYHWNKTEARRVEDAYGSVCVPLHSKTRWFFYFLFVDFNLGKTTLILEKSTLILERSTLISVKSTLISRKSNLIFEKSTLILEKPIFNLRKPDFNLGKIDLVTPIYDVVRWIYVRTITGTYIIIWN